MPQYVATITCSHSPATNVLTTGWTVALDGAEIDRGQDVQSDVTADEAAAALASLNTTLTCANRHQYVAEMRKLLGGLMTLTEMGIHAHAARHGQK
jgi:hypothetical protein